MPDVEKPDYFVIVTPRENGEFQVSIARDGPGKYEIVSREQLTATFEAAIQVAESETK